MKEEIRILGLDDGPSHSKQILIVGTIYRGGSILDGIISTHVTKDGTDSTDRLIRMITKSKFKPRCIMLDGIAFGGFNVVDIVKLNKKTKIPVMTVMRDLPDMDRIEKALKNLPNSKERLTLMHKAGPIHSVGDIFVQVAGTDILEASEFLKVSTLHAKIPEPLRVAHMIASGVKGDR